MSDRRSAVRPARRPSDRPTSFAVAVAVAGSEGNDHRERLGGVILDEFRTVAGETL